VVEQRQPPGHDPGLDADPVGEFFGLPAAVGRAHYLVPGRGQCSNDRPHRLGLAGAGRPDHRPDHPAAGQHGTDHLGLLAGQPRRLPTAGAAQLVADPDDRLLDPPDRHRERRLVLAQVQQVGLGVEQVDGRVHRFGPVASSAAGEVEQDDAGVGEEPFGQHADGFGVEPVTGPGGDCLVCLAQPERRLMISQSVRSGQPVVQPPDLAG
jgi:hypothetical protein